MYSPTKKIILDESYPFCLNIDGSLEDTMSTLDSKVGAEKADEGASKQLEVGITSDPPVE